MTARGLANGAAHGACRQHLNAVDRMERSHVYVEYPRSAMTQGYLNQANQGDTRFFLIHTIGGASRPPED